ncbi:hypothetical protein NDU88_002424 [Pleurodeles waltl]|uniref:Uncharacterized protein n=1 Tax=Pleurodeles waltl TaxID=8319 RepID=A0AAV7RCP3_PLEWA|nr:hypothetical protein NDU88_002424 [Pleurodeles waltl]
MALTAGTKGSRQGPGDASRQEQGGQAKEVSRGRMQVAKALVARESEGPPIGIRDELSSHQTLCSGPREAELEKDILLDSATRAKEKLVEVNTTAEVGQDPTKAWSGQSSDKRRGQDRKRIYQAITRRPPSNGQRQA